MREKGISELYRGLYLRAVHCVFSDLIYYGTFSMLQNRKEGRTPFENGTLAGIITNVLTIPVDTVSTPLLHLKTLWDLQSKCFAKTQGINFQKRTIADHT